MKKWLGTSLSGLLLFGMLAGGVSAEKNEVSSVADAAVKSNAVEVKKATFSDMSTHWAKDAVQLWSGRGIVQGSEDRLFAPNREITRAEWTAMINRMFQYQGKSATTFSDVQPEAWYAKDASAALAAGYATGYSDGTFRPNGTLSRQEAAVTVSRILKLQGGSGITFNDASSIPAWSKEAVAAASAKKLIEGYTDGSFVPGKALTRAEAIQILDRTFKEYGDWYGEGAVYGPEKGLEKKGGSVVVNSAGVTLQNMDIAGDLIIGKQVGDGDVYLRNVNVHGKTYVYGGGENSVHLEDSVLLTVIVNKQDGTVRLVASGKTTVQEITIQTGAKLEAAKGADISKVSLSDELPEKSRVYLTGDFETVDVLAKSISIQVPSGSIGELNVADSADATSIEVSKEAKILNAILNAAVSILGEGSIEKAVVNASGITMDKAPGKVELGSAVPKDTNIKIGGIDKPADQWTAKTPSVPSTGSGSGGGGSTPNTGGGSGDPGNGGSTDPGNGNGGGNGGGSTPGGGYDGGTWFSIGIESDTVTVTESVYINSPRTGYAYFTDSRVDGNNPVMLEAAVEAGAANKVPVTALTRTELPTTGVAKGFGSSYRAFVVDEQGKVSYVITVTVLDGADSPLKQKGMILSGSWTDNQESYFIYFNRAIQAVDGFNVRDYIQYSAKSALPDFKALDPNDKVEMKTNGILITPQIASLGKSTYFRLLPGAVETLDGAYKNELYTSTAYSSFTRADLIDYPGKWDITVPIGTVLNFKVNYSGDVYFVYRDTYGTQTDFDKEVTDGHGLKLSVSDDAIDEVYAFDTKDLQEGEYKLYPFGGYTIQVTLTKP
ncbi:hypothetical protein GRF59_22215 [Paenibacillus sp. HJL G12]|uniref:SLH domain-containing protein n=1 Tax=Paenibacillus dendrobii TaxID=2691084 RepID=A0A7X3ILT8_9BACL|nr:S-layer homology domain-containing protein [Paenibacillus dendrobii]MWV46323.1 hypothetical protein [Paenibacillus dendrobii]